jgi:hypothetical protein
MLLKPNEKILNKEACNAIQGAVFEVYREMGNGFLKAVYQKGHRGRAPCASIQLSEGNWIAAWAPGQLWSLSQGNDRTNRDVS